MSRVLARVVVVLAAATALYAIPALGWWLKAGPGEDPCGKAHPDRPYTCQRRARHDVCVSWQSGAGADAWVVDYDDLVRQIEDLRAVLDKLLDPHACHYDHHGDCQEHGTGAERPCPHSRAKELLGWSAP